MATSRRILITSENTGSWQAERDEETAAKVTELLQQDFEKHHVFFNSRGFHNHLLTLYGLGAPISALETKKAIPVKHNVVTELQRNWSANAPKYLGVSEHYPDFLAFFQLEIEEREIRSSDSLLRNAAEWKDSDPLFEGVLGRTLKEAIQLAASLRVEEQDVDERTAKMLHHNAYVSAASSQYASRVPRYDFFLILTAL
ncbi:hypothetical protein E4U58_000998 [Claviceps cyperi]|nr:hypothetical protein E4U58_000998 [Claviceps cyperi]